MGICTKCNNNGATSALIIVALLLFLSSVFLWIKWTIYKQYKKDNQTQVKEVKTTIRIFFVSYQILASIPTSAPSSKLPSNFLAMLARINFLDLNTFQLFNMGCMSGGINYHVQLVIVTTLPLVLCGSLWCYGNFFNKKVSGVSRAASINIFSKHTHTPHTHAALGVRGVVQPGHHIRGHAHGQQDHLRGFALRDARHRGKVPDEGLQYIVQRQQLHIVQHLLRLHALRVPDRGADAVLAAAAEEEGGANQADSGGESYLTQSSLALPN